MDETRRQITKIAREVSKFTVRTLRLDGVGTSEYDFIHAVRKNPGITQAGVREILGIDKGAAARRCTNLEAKGYLVRRQDPEDGRSRRLYPTEKAETLKLSKAAAEAAYYEWLTEPLTAQDRASFLRILDALYRRSKAESKAGFPHAAKRLSGEEEL
ncbi:MAG: MarR family winged helix-turn-helix transcriptional regulator [Oscillibacter sp.]|jgi:DNA-binding MarR family transcriptional regulator|nr:MarR family winged helix-turn-helix transcriptional regulator [Oscillibacter sp.]